MNNDDVLKRIEKLYLERKWSVYRLSKESGIHQSTLSSLFSRRSTVSLSNLDKICEAFHIPMSQFFEGIEKGEKKQSLTYLSMEIAEDFGYLSANNQRLIKTMMTTMKELNKESEEYENSVPAREKGDGLPPEEGETE